MNSASRLLRAPVLVSSTVGVAALAVYCATMAPGLTFIDSGELATVAATLGIAHPTGYPLFTLVGHLVSLLPLGAEPVQRLNVMTAVFCAVGVAIFTGLVHFLLTKTARKETDNRSALSASGCAGLLLAFSETYWSQATSVEVYALHALLVISVLLVFLRANDGHAESLWLLFAFLLGLSFTNHMTTILLAPAFLYYYLSQHWRSRRSWMQIVRMSPAFLLGLSVYLYLPLRASENPVMDWGRPVTVERFLWHWSGKQYRSWIFSSMEAAGKQLSYFLSTFPPEFVYLGGILALIGIVRLWKSDRRLFIFTVLLFLTCIGYSINYDIHDIDSYFLLAYITTALWAGWGALAVIEVVSSRGMLRRATPVLLPALCALIPVLVLYPRQNDRQNYLVEDYTKNMFASLDSNAVVLSYQWDYWVSASYYDQLVRGERVDVTVIDKELLRRSWYFNQLAVRYPWLVARSQKEIEAFLQELDKFEHERPYNSSIIEARYTAMIHSFIEKSLLDHPVYVCPEIEPGYTRGYQRVPVGLALRLYTDTLFHPSDRVRFTYRPLDRTGRLEDQVRTLYADALVMRGDYYFRSRGDLAEAAWAYGAARDFAPESGIIAERLKFVSQAQNLPKP